MGQERRFHFCPADVFLQTSGGGKKEIDISSFLDRVVAHANQHWAAAHRLTSQRGVSIALPDTFLEEWRLFSEDEKEHIKALLSTCARVDGWSEASFIERQVSDMFDFSLYLGY